MPDLLHLQIALKAAPAAIFRALTDELPAWFAEHADVSLPDKRYDFWGRYTPEAPDREAGRHPLLDCEPDKRLRFGWRLRGQDATIEYTLYPRGDDHILAVREIGFKPGHDIGAYTDEDFWFLSLENLRRHLDGRPPVRCDFSAPMVGDIRHEIEIAGKAEAVFEALIRPEQLNRWIASNAVVEPVVGGRYDLGWGQNTGALKILELVPNEKLALTWPQGERESVVTWTLTESGGKTRLTLVHSGFGRDEQTGGLQTGWRNFMSWIKSLVEYGADWQPPLIRLKPQQLSFYPASIESRQAEILSEPEYQERSMKLGTYAEILLSVADVNAARDWYTRLGFRPVRDDLLLDNGNYLRLSSAAFSSPTLHYKGGDLSALEGLGIGAKREGDSLSFTHPNGVRVLVSAADSDTPMLPDAPLSRQPNPRLGKFGEFSFAVSDFAASSAFWQKLGFEQMYAAAEPYPWGILSDGLVLLGLHQNPESYPPTLTYFAGDMAERIAALQADGFTVKDIMPEADGKIANGMLTSPDSQNIFVFTGEI